MVTGASTADLAIILIDARKGVLTQTRRHSYLVSLLGIRHVVLAVNKMDLVDYSADVFERIEADYRDVRRADRARRRGLHPDVGRQRRQRRRAQRADAVVSRADAAGAPRDGAGRTQELAAGPFRMPVQWVNRPNLDFRGFAGIDRRAARSASATRSVVLPSGRQQPRCTRIVDGDHGGRKPASPVSRSR